MNDDRAFERATRDWLEAGSDSTPAATIDAVLLAVRTTPQERDLRIPWRMTALPTPIRLVAAIAIFAVAGFAALSLFKAPAIGPNPTPSPTVLVSPTTTPTSTPAPSPTAPTPGAEFPSGVIPPGTYHSTRFAPVVVVTLPKGWTELYEDAEGLVLTKGTIEIYFTHAAAAVSARELNLLMNGGTGVPSASPGPVTLGSYAGFQAGPGDGGGTIFIDSGLRAWDSAPGSLVWGWVVDMDGRALSIEFTGPADEATAALGEVRAILDTLGQAPAAAVAIPRGLLPAGTYTTTVFAPTVSFTTTGGWINKTETSDRISLYVGDISHQVSIARVVGDPIVYARTNPDYVINSPTATTIAGLAAEQTTFVLSADATVASFYPLSALADSAKEGGDATLELTKPGAAARVITVNVGGTVVVILVQEPIGDASGFDAMVDALLASIAFK